MILKRNNVLLIIGLVLMLSACSFFKKEDTKGTAIAHAGDSFLYKEDLPDGFSKGLSKDDSIALVTNHINDWAVTQLLLSRAKINLSEEKLADFNNLVASYQADLYTRAYKDALMQKSLDTVIKEFEMKSFYDKNKENFKLNDALLKLRYIELSPQYADVREIKQRLRRYSKKDSTFLDSINIQFKNHSFSLNNWVSKAIVIRKIPGITVANGGQYLNKSQFLELKDSVGVYLVDIKEVLQRNDIAPLSYIKPTIKQILLNKRKLAYVKQLENDVLKEAVDKNEFKIYE